MFQSLLRTLLISNAFMFFILVAVKIELKDLNNVWTPRIGLAIIPPGKTCKFQFLRGKMELESIIGGMLLERSLTSTS